MKHIKKFNENATDTLTISAGDMQIFAKKHVNPKYPGLEYESDTDSGDFDAEKGAMTDYLIYLRDKETREIIWESEGGYFTAQTGEMHHYQLTFTRFQQKDIKGSSMQLAKDIMEVCRVDLDEVDPEYVDHISNMILDWYNKNK